MPTFSRRLASLILLVGLAGCGGPKVDVSSEGRVEVEVGDTKVEAVTDDLAEVKIPADFPTDVHIPAGGKPQVAGQIAGTRVLTLKYTGVALEGLAEEIRTKMLAAQWTEDSGLVSPDAAVYAFSKGDRLAAYTIGKSESQLDVSINLSSKQ